MIRVVIDTNVVVSGLLTPRGNAALVLLAVHRGVLRPCVSVPILDEYAAVLARPKFGFAAAEIDNALGLMRSQAEIAAPPPSPFVSPDPGDTKFIDCAVATSADFIVTGNARHFPDSPYGVSQVLGAGELLRRLTLELGAGGQA